MKEQNKNEIIIKLKLDTSEFEEKVQRCKDSIKELENIAEKQSLKNGKGL